jgi:hypothetical protein
VFARAANGNAFVIRHGLLCSKPDNPPFRPPFGMRERDDSPLQSGSYENIIRTKAVFRNRPHRLSGWQPSSPPAGVSAIKCG